MTFLSPWFLVGAVASALPIVLHLLKREPEPRVKFPAVRLLKRAPVEYTERRHLRELLLLALRVGMLVLLAVAFARPFFHDAAAAPSGTTIVALDTSYSMSPPAVFESARRRALDAVDRAGVGERIGILTFADVSEVLVEPTLDRSIVRSAIEQAAPGFGATRYRGAFAAAVQELESQPGTIVMVTDLQANGWDAGDRVAIPESIRVQVLPVETTRSNLAVTSIRVESGRVLATVRNSGDATHEARVHLDLDGRAASDAQTTIGPRSSADVDLGAAGHAATAAVTVDDRNGVDADNVRYAVFAPVNGPSVLIVTSTGDEGREGFYLRQALSPESPGRGYTTAVIAAGRVPELAAQLSASSAVFLLSTRGLERRSRESLTAFVRDGGGLVIAAGPDVDGEVAADLLGDGKVLTVAAPSTPAPSQSLTTDDRHPMFRSFRSQPSALGLATFQRTSRIDGTGCDTIGRFSSGERALLDCTVGKGHVIVIASDLDNRWNDLPRRATFVPLVQDAMRYLVRDGGWQSEYLVADVPKGVAPRPGIVAIPSLGDPVQAENGVGAPRPNQRRERRAAVNVDTRESESDRLSLPEFERAVARLKETGAAGTTLDIGVREDRQHLWMYVLVLTLGVLAVEGVLASRTA